MKKILSLTLAVIMVLSMIPTAFAAQTDYTNGTTVTYSADASEQYTVKVPATLAPGASGTVELSGTWPTNRKITVTADTSVRLTNSINSNDYKDLAVTFAGMEYAGDNTAAKTYTENVSVAAMPTDALFGTWSGTFYYNVNIEDVAEESIATFRLTKLSDGMEVGESEYTFLPGMTWGEWVESEYNTDGYEVHSDNTIRGSDGYVFNSSYTDYIYASEEIISGAFYGVMWSSPKG